MASKKKVKKKKERKAKRGDDAAGYAGFMQSLMDGSLVAVVQLYESRDENGGLVLEYDEEVDA